MASETNWYLRAIGISRAERSTLSALKDVVINAPDSYIAVSRQTDKIFVEFSKDLSPGIGVTVRYVCDSDEEVEALTFWPYCLGRTSKKYVDVEIQGEDGEYAAIAEDIDNGNELVFSLQNPLDLGEDLQMLEVGTIRLSGLGREATIILPVYKDEFSEQLRQQEERDRKEQLRRARQGDVLAKENLEYAEEETSDIISERLAHEDFLTVIESFLMPLDDDDTHYFILGDITKAEKCANELTGEKLYRLSLNVAGSPIDICINAQDVTGLPSEGMRFMGTCWLQGRIDPNFRGGRNG